MVRDAPGSFRSDWVGGMLTYLQGDSVGGERLLRRGTGDLRRQRRDVAGLTPTSWSISAAGPRPRTPSGRSFLADSNMVPEAARAVGYYVQTGDLARADSYAGRSPGTRGRLERDRYRRLPSGARPRRRRPAPLALRRRVARAHPEDWRYWLLTGEAALRAGACADLAESVARLERLAPPAAARRTSGLRTARLPITALPQRSNPFRRNRVPFRWTRSCKILFRSGGGSLRKSCLRLPNTLNVEELGGGTRGAA